jgi:hypothetical protein
MMSVVELDRYQGERGKLIGLGKFKAGAPTLEPVITHTQPHTYLIIMIFPLDPQAHPGIPWPESIGFIKQIGYVVP